MTNYQVLDERGSVEKALSAATLGRSAPSSSSSRIQRPPIPKLIQTANINQSDQNDLSIRNRRKNKNKTASKCTFLLLLLIFTLTFGFIIGAFFNYFCEYEYERVFEDKIHISSKYIPNTLLHSVRVNFKHKDLRFDHRLVPKPQHDDQHNYVHKHHHDDKDHQKTHDHMHEHKRSENVLLRINRYIRNAMNSLNHLLDYKTKDEQEIRIFEKERFEFKMSKIDRKLLKQDNQDVECYDVNVTNRIDNTYTTGEVETCLDLGNHSWFGGHESYDQPYWPINMQKFDYVAYETGFPDMWGAVFERYWLSSNGMAIFIDDDVPLWVKKIEQNKLCLKASNLTKPYLYTPVYQQEKFSYRVCNGPDIKTVHFFMVNNYLGKPESPPDELMMKSPIWTTWNYFFREINTSVVYDFAQQIVANNYSRSQLEIDDKWEKNYGDLEFAESFGNVNDLTGKLHDLGFRVTLWVHPFCNIDSENFVDGSYRGIWVREPSGQQPAFTSWWNGNTSAIVDTTNPDGVSYFTAKLNNLRSKYQIDSFKFDAGESSWVPSQFSLFDKNATLAEYSQKYVDIAANQNNFVEVRTANRLQKKGVFFRILDRASDWSIHDGLKSVITETLQFSLLGYPFVLPDMIGGNSGPDKSQKELFIRWIQLNAFLPAMQFGVPPWYFDQETNDIGRYYVKLREQYLFPYMWSLANALDGQTIIRPLWWIDPLDTNTFEISDQFLLGDQILVAPVVEPNATSRDIYLPKGSWISFDSKKTFTGPTWLRNYPAPIYYIPFFVIDNDGTNILNLEKN